MNGTKVRDLITTMGDIHHIFPKSYLQQNGLNDKSIYNQIANYTYLDTTTNISIADKSPSVYIAETIEQCNSKKLKYGNIADISVFEENLKVNCIPADIVNMEFDNFDEFLLKRRKLMANKIRNYYHRL